jgi:hypothetical protein
VRGLASGTSSVADVAHGLVVLKARNRGRMSYVLSGCVNIGITLDG